MWEAGLRVAVRVRPLLPKEESDRQVSVRIVPDTAQVTLGGGRAFSFDFAFGPKAQQGHVYQSCVEPLVASFFDGHDATVLAYGQSRSGKTYTLGGGHDVPASETDAGITWRVARDVFHLMAEKADTDFTMRASFFEVCGDELKDLLSQPSAHIDLHIGEDERGNTMLAGAREIAVCSAEELLSVLRAANALRSSRSHAILTLHLSQRRRHHHSAALVSQLRLVDLAGSERALCSGNVDQSFRRSVQINADLLSLGNMIQTLSEQWCRHGRHVKCSDTKIARLLRDSLSGSTRTLIVACVSPSSHSLGESLSCLRFALRARAIRNQQTMHWDSDDTQVGDVREHGLAAGMAGLCNSLKDNLERCEESRGTLEEGLLYQSLTQDAAILLEELQSSTPSPAQQQRMMGWLDTYKTLNPTHCIHQQDSWGTNLHMFSERDAELRQLKSQVSTLLLERQTYLASLQEERQCSRLQNEMLVEQKLLIGQLRGNLLTSKPSSAPQTNQHPNHKSHFHGSTRKRHTNPPPYCLERVMATIQTCNQLLLAKMEERDEVLCLQSLEKAMEKEDEEEVEQEKSKKKCDRGLMNRTWTRRQNPALVDHNDTDSTKFPLLVTFDPAGQDSEANKRVTEEHWRMEPKSIQQKEGNEENSTGQQDDSENVSVEELHQEKASLQQRRVILDNQLKDVRELTMEEQRALFQLEEAVEALDAAIEFKNHSIHGRPRLVRCTHSPAHRDVVRKLRDLSLPQATALLLKYIDKVVCLRESDRRLQLRCKEQESKVAELQAALQLREGQVTGTVERDKLSHSKIQELERDLFFYKSTSRELRRKIKELVNDATSLDTPSNRAQCCRGSGDGAHGEGGAALQRPVQ